jgi:hypothetical protein
MGGILPTPEAGGIIYRDIAGVALNPPGVQNAYSPPATFVANCGLTALPSDCTARIEAKQINAIVSELISLAECFDPNGVWDCGSFNNLCAAFQQWVISDSEVDGISIVGTGSPADPFTVGTIDCGSY